MSEITILGGGVNGISTALVLEILGHDTTLVTAERGDQIDVNSASREFATAWPAGAIYPVSVEKENLEECFSISQRFFRMFWEHGIFGVTRQKFNHLFESYVEEPEFADLFDNYRELEREKAKPSRNNVDGVKGYTIDMFSAEMDIYLKKLYKLYTEIGGDIEEKKTFTK